MTATDHSRVTTTTRPSDESAPQPVSTNGSATSEPGSSQPSRWLAGLRLSTGFIFLWAFLDKTLGLGYATQSDEAWIDGGSPTEGFLSGVAVGPLESTFHDWAGQAWADWLFMVALAAIGIAVVLGVGLRVAAVSGTVMMALMWAAEWPPARHTSSGELSMSNNPLVDYHVIYAVALIVIAVTYAGDRWGLGRTWGRLPIVQRYRSVLR